MAVRTRALAAAVALAAAAVCAVPGWRQAGAQMHKVNAPEQVTRAVGVYEFLGDPEHPKAARFIPVSLFIGGHFEDAGVYLARPVPFALQNGFRYELEQAGVRKDYFDLVAARNFTNSAVAANLPFDDGWFGYGRVVKPAPPKAGKVRPNCGNAHVVQEVDNSKPHFGSKPADDSAKPVAKKDANAPDPCRDMDDDRPEKISLADDRKPGDNSPDPERPTLHRSPESTANNTGANSKPDKKATKPPPATVTANAKPADDPDRPTIRHRTTDENDPNALPPDPLEYSAKVQEKATDAKRAAKTGVPVAANSTVTSDATIDAGDTMSGGPRLQRGKPAALPADAPTAGPKGATAAKLAAVAAAAPPVLDTIVAVSDAKDRAAHDFTYKFTSQTERAAAVSSLEAMAQAVLANPALATDAPEGTVAKAAPVAAAHPVARTPAARAAAARAAAKAKAAAAADAVPVLVDEEVNAYQLYYSAPITYAFSARVAATDASPERYVTVIAQTDAEGKLQPALRTVTDALHLDRVPRYRLIDVVDADGSNRASLLMELRAQRSRQFALYRLLGNKPDQVFVSGSTLL